MSKPDSPSGIRTMEPAWLSQRHSRYLDDPKLSPLPPRLRNSSALKTRHRVPWEDEDYDMDYDVDASSQYRHSTAASELDSRPVSGIDNGEEDSNSHKFASLWMKYSAHRERKDREKQAEYRASGLQVPGPNGSGNGVYLEYEDEEADFDVDYDEYDEKQKARDVPVEGDVDLPQVRYKDRLKKAREKSECIPVVYHVEDMLKRQTFICVLCNALFSFGAPQHRIEEQLMAAARILNVRMGVIQLPAIAWIAFPRQGGLDKSLHIIRCQEGLALGKLHQVHQISRRVMHDEIYASEGRRQIDVLLNSGPEYGLALGIFLQFWISAIICGLAFGGSFLDMWVGGFAGASMRFMQSRVQDKTKYYLADLCLATLISFAARGLSSITVPDQLFCYTAITYSGIVGILPGFLVLTAALEIASRNMMTGGIKVVRALALTLFIGFALQLGDQLWRIVDPAAMHNVKGMALSVRKETHMSGTIQFSNVKPWPELNDTVAFTYLNVTENPFKKDIHAGCYRPDTFPWYLRSWPWWTQIFAVPIFSALASLGNQQPWRSWDFPVMVVISCAAYAANWAANHFIHSRLEFVAFIGAFVVGLIGSVYSRVAKRTAFTVMVTGVCFLVPSGLAETGGISAQDNAIPIEYAMIRTGLGIAVGLLFSAILTYSIGGTKHSGTMTF